MAFVVASISNSSRAELSLLTLHFRYLLFQDLPHKTVPRRTPISNPKLYHITSYIIPNFGYLLVQILPNVRKSRRSTTSPNSKSNLISSMIVRSSCWCRGSNSTGEPVNYKYHHVSGQRWKKLTKMSVMTVSTVMHQSPSCPC